MKPSIDFKKKMCQIKNEIKIYFAFCWCNFRRYSNSKHMHCREREQTNTQKKAQKERRETVFSEICADKWWMYLYFELNYQKICFNRHWIFGIRCSMGPYRYALCRLHRYCDRLSNGQANATITIIVSSWYIVLRRIFIWSEMLSLASNRMENRFICSKWMLCVGMIQFGFSCSSLQTTLSHVAIDTHTPIITCQKFPNKWPISWFFSQLFGSKMKQFCANTSDCKTHLKKPTCLFGYLC